MKSNNFFEIADWQIADCKLEDYRVKIAVSDCKFQIDVVGTRYEFNLKMR